MKTEELQETLVDLVDRYFPKGERDRGRATTMMSMFLIEVNKKLSLARLEGEKAERERILKELDQVERTAWRDADHCACLRFAIHKIEDPEVEALEQEEKV